MKPRKTNCQPYGYATIAVIALLLAILCGCSRTSKSSVASGRELNGRLVCSESVPGYKSFTNYFHIFLGENIYLIQLRDINQELIVQASYDGQDTGYWWRSPDTNVQTTAWIYSWTSSTNKLTDAVPPLFRYPEDLIVFPLIWSSPDASPKAVAYVKENYFKPDVFPEISFNNYPAGIYVTNHFDVNFRLTNMVITTFVATNIKSDNFRVTLYDVCFDNYISSSNLFLPTHYTILDKRLGFGLNKCYSIDITNISFAILDMDNIYPDIRQFNTYMIDWRLGLKYHIQGKPWPSRFYLRNAKHSPDSMSGRLIWIRGLILLLFISPIPILVFRFVRSKQTKQT